MKEKIENNKYLKCTINVFDKIAFVLEFILSIFMSYSVYKVVIIKNYLNNWNVKYLLVFGTLLVIIIGIIWYICRKYKDKIEKVFISFLIPIGMLFVFFIAPGYVPDEQAHIWRAYQISTGTFITEKKEDGTSPTIIPEFYQKSIIPYVKSYEQFENKKLEITDYSNLIEVVNPAQTYPSVLYIMSSIAFLLGRIFNVNGIFVIYFAKILNFMIFLIFGYYSIKIIPFGKKILGVILFLPMALQQGASISADCILNSISMFYIAYTLYLCKVKKDFNWKDAIIYIVMSTIIAISKIAYAPIIGLIFMFLTIKKKSLKKRIIFIISVVLVCSICCIGMYVKSKGYETSAGQKVYLEENNVNTSEQINSIISNPVNVIKAMISSVTQTDYIEQAIGSKLGWLNIITPNIVINCFAIMLILAPFLDENKQSLNIKEKIWVIAIFIGTYGVIALGMYLIWTTVASTTISGIQGRYLLPILALPLVAMCGTDRYIKNKYLNIIIPILASGLNIMTIITVVKFFM